jgi:hypothetical protein
VGFFLIIPLIIGAFQTSFVQYSQHWQQQQRFNMRCALAASFAVLDSDNNGTLSPEVGGANTDEIFMHSTHAYTRTHTYEHTRVPHGHTRTHTDTHGHTWTHGHRSFEC